MVTELYTGCFLKIFGMDNKPDKSDYSFLLNDIRSIIDRGLSKAYKAVDNLRVQTYWQIGERIVREELQHKDRADYGGKLIEHLSEDLGFVKRDIYRFVTFYKTYPIVTSLVSQLSWTHYTVLISIQDIEKRIFYEQQTVCNMWSVRELQRQIKNQMYENVKNDCKTSMTLPVLSIPAVPENIFKNTYHFDFLELKDGYDEAELEKGMISNIEKILLEFGADFSLSGRQKKIIIDGQVHAVDIEFYHRGIPCVVLVELKTGRFKGEYIGQMNKYLNWYKENKRYNWEKDPIGIIICRNKGAEEVHYALGGISNRIFVAEYKLKLPSKDDIGKLFAGQ